MKVSIEYTASKTKNKIILPGLGRSQSSCDRVGVDNLGVTVDVNHVVLAGELPDAEVAVAPEAGRLR